MNLDSECDSTDCKSCQQVIVRTYRELRKCGQDDVSAFRSALRVLALRHPERKREEHIAIASRWLSDALEI